MSEIIDKSSASHPWVKDKVLGTGGFGTVTLWRHSDTGDTIALKKCRWGGPTMHIDNVLTPKHIERWEKEVEIMNRLEHSAVIKCFPVPRELQGTPGELPMLCMEYCSEGDLRKVLNKAENCCGLKEVQVRHCLHDMTEAVAYLHSLRIIHRDLKPENIVLQNTEGQVRYKLIDLGYAKELEQGSVCTSFVGTLQYLAPELFLSKRYSCTVDYWSLGLVTHEILTGVRPFLPNMTPVEWMKKVKSKRHDHICVFEGRDGGVQFSSAVFPETHVGPPLKKELEQWLRVMLEWDPNERGQGGNAGGERKVAFPMIREILAKKIIKVFLVESCELLEYAVTEADSMTSVRERVAEEAGLPVEDQRPLLPRGQPPDASRPATQCWAPPDEDEWLLYVFGRGVGSRGHVAPRFPPLVEEMLRQSKVPFEYQMQRRMWSHAVFFLRKETNLLNLLAQAHKVSMLHLMSLHAQLTKSSQKMLTDIAKLQARHNLFMEALNSDLDLYDDQTSQGITSDRLYRSWREMGDKTLREVHTCVERARKAEAAVGQLNTKVLEVQCSPFARGKAGEALDAIITASEDMYSSLRRRPKETRAQKGENTEMCKLMVQALRRRDRVHNELYKHLEKQCDCLAEVGELTVPLESALQDIARTAQTISTQQARRQKDIWKLINIAVSHKTRASSAPPDAASLPAAPTALPYRSMSPAVLTALGTLLEQSTKEAKDVIGENRTLRAQMLDFISLNIPTTLKVGGCLPAASGGAIPKRTQRTIDADHKNGDLTADFFTEGRQISAETSL